MHTVGQLPSFDLLGRLSSCKMKDMCGAFVASDGKTSFLKAVA